MSMLNPKKINYKPNQSGHIKSIFENVPDVIRKTLADKEGYSIGLKLKDKNGERDIDFNNAYEIYSIFYDTPNFEPRLHRDESGKLYANFTVNYYMGCTYSVEFLYGPIFGSKDPIKLKVCYDYKTINMKDLDATIAKHTDILAQELKRMVFTEATGSDKPRMPKGKFTIDENDNIRYDYNPHGSYWYDSNAMTFTIGDGPVQKAMLESIEHNLHDVLGSTMTFNDGLTTYTARLK